eukprot:9487955-Ditylum_brightwellii.AAC.1
MKSGFRKWGNRIKQVQAPVLIIECVASETAYLKLASYGRRSGVYRTTAPAKCMAGSHQLEAATTVEMEGKWFLIYYKDQYEEVTDFIDKVLPELYTQIDNNYILEDYEIPFRHMKRNTLTHCSYTEALKGLVETSNPQEEEYRKYNQPTERTRK